MENLLIQTGFDKLLNLLDASDRESAGAKYESLRVRLIKFFEWRNCENAEELTDIVFDRLVKKIADGEQIQNVSAYSANIARFVLLEDSRRREKFFSSIEENSEAENVAKNESDDDELKSARLNCLDKCLAEFSDENRRLVVAYYDTNERTMITIRKKLADALGISLNVLRIRVCRLKAKLEDCTKDCCRKIA